MGYTEGLPAELTDPRKIVILLKKEGSDGRKTVEIHSTVTQILKNRNKRPTDPVYDFIVGIYIIR